MMRLITRLRRFLNDSILPHLAIIPIQNRNCLAKARRGSMIRVGTGAIHPDALRQKGTATFPLLRHLLCITKYIRLSCPRF